MRCPKCGQNELNPAATCTGCQYSGEPALLEKLANIQFLLAEAKNWTVLSKVAREELEQRYGRQQRQVEVALGLRLPPLDAAEAQTTRLEIARLNHLWYVAIGEWARQGWINWSTAHDLKAETGRQLNELQNRLTDAPETDLPAEAQGYNRLRLVQMRFLLDKLAELKANNRLTRPAAYEQATAVLNRDIEQLEVKMGLRPPVRVKGTQEPPLWTPSQPVTPPSSPVSVSPAPLVSLSSSPPVVERPVEKRPPLTWERIWETLLTRRTLQALLFLGAGLLVAAAWSLVYWSWDTFSPGVQVAFLVGNTAILYGLGWYVRAQMKLREGGIALSAVASLFVPLDFFVFYRSGSFPQAYWAEMWLVASAVCLAAYLLTTYLIQAEFFGYLVAVAAGSLLTAGLQLLGVPPAWWQAGLAGLALALALVALLADGRKWWRLLVNPFWQVAALGMAAVLVLASAYWLLGRTNGYAFLNALAADWWFGGVLFVLAAGRYRTRWFALAAAIAFPLAAWLTQQSVYQFWELPVTWYALGWALLTPLYLLTGYWLTGRAAEDELFRTYRQMALWGSGLLAVVAFFWSLPNVEVIGLVHPILAATSLLAVWLWKRPVLLNLTSFLLVTTTMGWVAGRGGTPGQLGLAWALLAILHIVVAVRVARVLGLSERVTLTDRKEHRQKEREKMSVFSSVREKFRMEAAEAIWQDVPTIVFRAGWLIAGVAILPALVTLDRAVLTYTLGNWIAINGWLAILAHEDVLRIAYFVGRKYAIRNTQYDPLFHWCAALSLLPWLWLLWTNRRPAEAAMGLAFAGLAWGLLWFGLRLKRVRWQYGRPWFGAAQVAQIVALAVPLIFFEQVWAGGLWLAAAVFYFASARLLHSRVWLVAGGAVLPLGWLLTLDSLNLPLDPLLWSFSLVTLAYVVAAAWLERRRVNGRQFYQPLYDVAQVLAVATFGWSLQRVLFIGSDPVLVWAAVTQATLAVSFTLYAFLFKREGYAHIAAWLGVFAGGFVALAYSQGRGSSAAKTALLAIAYVMAERLLYWGSVRRFALTDGREHGQKEMKKMSVFSFVREEAFLRNTQYAIRSAWRLFRRPLLIAGYAISAGSIGLALVRNLVMLGGGMVRETWAVIGLLLVTGLYVASAYLFRRWRSAPRFGWLAAGLVFMPWTILTHLGWYVTYLGYVGRTPSIPGYALAWALLAVGELVVCVMLAGGVGRLKPLLRTWEERGYGRWARAPQGVAHVLMPFALAWGAADVSTTSVTMGLAILFYLLAIWMDRRFEQTAAPSNRFVYPAAVLTPVWAVYLLARFAPAAPQESYGLLLLVFTLPMLLLGRWLARREPSYQMPLYLVAYGTAIIGTGLVVPERPYLIGALLFDTAIAVLSTWFFREPLWLYPATATLPAALLLTLAQWNVPDTRFGWALIGLGGGYLAVAAGLRRRVETGRYAVALMVAAYALIAIGLPLSSQDRLGAEVGYGLAALIYGISAVWLQNPIFFTAAAGLAIVPYWLVLLDLGMTVEQRGPALWPGIAVYMVIGHWLHSQWGTCTDKAGAGTLGTRGNSGELKRGEEGGGLLAPFPWFVPWEWPMAVAERLLRWWAMPFYAAAYGGTVAAVLFSLDNEAGLTLSLLLAALLYGYAVQMFRLRGWLLAAGAAAQLAALAAIGWSNLAHNLAEVLLLFTPVTYLTALAGLWLEWRLGEGPPLTEQGTDIGVHLWAGWSRPLYWLLLVDLFIVQSLGLAVLEWQSIGVTLAHVALLAVLATVWALPTLAYVPPLLGAVGLIQYLVWSSTPSVNWPWTLAVLALVYGLAGYRLRYFRQQRYEVAPVAMWERPLVHSGWLLSGLSLVGMVSLGIEMPFFVLEAFYGPPFLSAGDTLNVHMVVTVLALLGLLYVTAALVDRRRSLGYTAVAMMLGAYGLEWLLVWGQREVQWYVVPAALYLLGIGYLEWRQGSRPLARWIDRAALLLLFGSAFWQSLGDSGWPYYVLLLVEGLLVLWWGSTRRLRRFLYAGVAAVTIGTAGQLIEPLLSANRWIVFGVAGILLVGLAILVERRLEVALALSREVRQRLEEWE